MNREDKPKEYWEGVADALSLVETFVYWKEMHPNESKSLLEFIHDALKEAKKHIGPSLLDLLGVTFQKAKSKEKAELSVEDESLKVKQDIQITPTIQEDKTTEETKEGKETDVSFDVSVVSKEKDDSEDIPIF